MTMRTWRNARLYRRPLARDATAAGRLYRAAWRAGFPTLTVPGEAPFRIAAGAGAWHTFLLVADVPALAAATAALTHTQPERPDGR
jgi:hypothetical protein